MKDIRIQGARTHNLKNIDLTIPRDKLVIITGLSGSGKSSLAFDTLYAEGQRRYVESLSAYARQFLSMMEKPDVDSIEGLSPAISIEQKSTSHNPRSTVGTVTEIYDYLRLLYARVGEPRCPEHDLSLKAQTVSEMVDSVMQIDADKRMMLLAPVVRERKGEHLQLFEKLRSDGFVRVRVDGVTYELDEVPMLDKKRKHSIEVVVDRFKIREDITQRLAESFETALNLADGLAMVSEIDSDNTPILYSSRFACPICNYSLNELEPRLFSFNSPNGACSDCDGLGVQQFFDAEKIVQFPESSLSEGAIQGWDRQNFYYFQMLTSLANHYKFSVDTPFEKLSTNIHQILLYGSGKDIIEFEYHNDRGTTFIRKDAFEGVVNNFERRFRETTSESVRAHLMRYLTTSACKTCNGARLCEAARHVFVNNKNLPFITQKPVTDALNYFQTLNLKGMQQIIAEKIIKEIASRLQFLNDVGLSYLSLERSADTLSGGEAQRIRLASQIGSGLVGVMYVLDEPSIGLHQRDNQRLLATLTRLRDLGNTVIVVEHDEEAMEVADHIIDIGPGAGVHGGQVVIEGNLETIKASKHSHTGAFLSGRRSIAIPKKRLKSNAKKLTIKGASGNNLQAIDLSIPVGLFVCITGVSGSGKSTLINHTLYPLAATELNKATTLSASTYNDISGLQHFINCVNIDQGPIGRTPRSNPATYTGLFTNIRDIFAATPESRARGYKVGRFSFNVKGGRCEACQGDGVIRVEMHFLPDVYVTCEQCEGKRYNRETLEVQYRGKNIHQILDMTVEDALRFFEAVPSINKKLQTLADVGLTYIKLGQQATTLSGGEAQRIKLSKELSKRSTGQTLYILDEPTTGLHFHDIDLLLKVLHRLRNQGNTVIVIEHNLDVIKTADWVIDLGPEGGSGGGQIIAEGTPEQVAKASKSFTGHFLNKVLT